MAYDEGLTQRIREALDDRRDVSERKMFGGVAFMLGGNMCVGVVKDDLMVRVGPDAYEASLAEPDAREMDFTGRPMKGMLYVDAESIASDERLETWIARGVAFAGSLPPK
jgi:TfoX/Sxy family transcriptional regulator of competence genes